MEIRTVKKIRSDFTLKDKDKFVALEDVKKIITALEDIKKMITVLNCECYLYVSDDCIYCIKKNVRTKTFP